VVFQHAQYFANADPRRAHFTLRKIQIGDECSIMEKTVISAGINRIHIGRRVHCQPYSTVGDSVPDRAIFQTRSYTVPALPASGRTERYGGGTRSTFQSICQFSIVMMVVVLWMQPVSVMTMLWFEWLNPNSDIGAWTYYALLPIWWNVWGGLTCFLVCLPCLRIFVGTVKVKPGEYSIHSWTYIRNVWLRDLMLTFNEDAFGIFAYTPVQKYLLRFLGAKIGPRVEMADSIECVRIPFHMLRMDEGAFTTGGVSVGCYRVMNGRWLLEDGLVHFQKESFLGNRSCVAHPCKLRPASLVGACSYLNPFSIVRRNNVAFGIPAESLPVNYHEEGVSKKKKLELAAERDGCRMLSTRMACLFFGHLLGDCCLGAAILIPLLPIIFKVPAAWFTDLHVILIVCVSRQQPDRSELV
jgi:carbonic anhydrase/acetyltransferase-like protein (isoleucine patch superfamily)